jgi:DNA-binding MarR family transcriptional regulator
MDSKPHIATLIRRVHLAIRQEGVEQLRAAGFTDLTMAHIYVFQTPGPDGVRPSELAARTNMTKQAMNHLLVTLESGGYLERVRSPDDGRGIELRLTERGREVERLIQTTSRRLEREWARRIGERDLAELRRILNELDQIETERGHSG